jgi:hypothetical protein
MRRTGKLFLGAFIVLAAALFVFAPMVPQTALGPWSLPSGSLYCGGVFFPTPQISYFVSPSYAVFHFGVVYVPQGGSLGWTQPKTGSVTCA